MSDLRHGKNLYRTCLSKRKYRTEERALEFAAKYTKEFGKQQYVYYCPYCFNFHITSAPRTKKEKEKTND